MYRSLHILLPFISKLTMMIESHCRNDEFKFNENVENLYFLAKIYDDD